MTVQFPSPSTDTIAPAEILVAAARCWRDACDEGEPIQPRLARILTDHGCAMLAPVLDSLYLFYESALGRRMAVGNARTRSEDEDQLVGLVDGSRPRACLDCGRDAGRTLDCALCSTRIMLAMTLGSPTAVQ
ncbi:hypothetical protein RN629_07010 [Sphingomonadaceae bacterium jetA1]|jgi:hypothetical protein|uniref:hypothetical protein n=1 Tax=Facivitalis istanbulensis TaxID=3075838 RepID=UPI00347D21CB